MITDVKITDNEIRFRIYGKLFQQPYYIDIPDRVDRDHAKSFARTLEYMAKTIIRVTEQGIPYKHYIDGKTEIGIGFDVCGRVILPDGKDDR